MGSKSKTIRSLGYSKLLPQRDEIDLYTERINKAVSYSASIDSSFINISLLDVNKAFNYKAFERLDGATESRGTMVSLDVATIYQALGLNCSEDEITSTELSTTLEDQFLYRKGRTESICTNEEGISNGGDYYTYRNFISNPDDSITADRYISASCVDTADGTETQPGIADDLLVVKVTDHGIPVTDYVYRMLSADGGVIDPLDSNTFLTTTYKANFVRNEGRYVKAMNAQLGIPQRTPLTKKKDCTDWDDVNNVCLDGGDTFESTLNNPDYKHIFLTYAVPYKDDYIAVIDDLYGTNGTLSIDFHGINLTIGPETVIIEPDPGDPTDYCSANITGGNYVIKVDGVTMSIDEDENEEKQYLIPMEYMLLRRTMREKYDDQQASFTMFVMAEKTVKIRWYQTGLFKILMWAVAVVAAVYGYPQMLIGLIGSTIATAIWGQMGAAIFGILMAIWTLGTSLITTGFNITMNMLSMVANLASSIANVYFTYTLDVISETMKDIADETKVVRDAIEEMGREALYIPFGDVVDNINYVMYDSVYDIYNSAYDYDNFTKISTLKNYSKSPKRL